MFFSEEEKSAIFDKIASMYFNKNFGSTTKTDFETFLFSEYLEHCLNSHLPYDDYTLSKELGITQSRVRALKERKELKYPHEGFDWRESFAESVSSAKYDDRDHYVKFIIQDINVMNEVRHFIESMGWYDECALNRKLLRIPLDCFTEICLKDVEMSSLFSAEARKKIARIAGKNDEIKKLLGEFTKDGLKSFIMTAGREAIAMVLSCLPFGGFAKVAFDYLAAVVKNS